MLVAGGRRGRAWGRGAAGGETPAGKGCRPARVPVQGWAAGPEGGGGTRVALTSRRVPEQPGASSPAAAATARPPAAPRNRRSPAPPVSGGLRRGGSRGTPCPFPGLSQDPQRLHPGPGEPETQLRSYPSIPRRPPPSEGGSFAPYRGGGGLRDRLPLSTPGRLRHRDPLPFSTPGGLGGLR